VLTWASTPDGLALKLEQSRATVCRDHDDIATTSAVAPIRATERDVLLASKRSASVSTSTADDMDMCFINEPH
jgi:hypothetical protein